MPSLKSLSRTKPSIKPCLARTSACLGVLATAGLAAHAQTSDSDKIDSLEKQNEALQLRLDTLENVVKQEGLMPSDTNVVTKSVISALGQVNISGFVQASYFYDTRRPANGLIDGYLWNTKDNSFSLNKFKLTIASQPVATDKWDAGFRASLLFGDDAPDLNTPGANGLFGANTSFNDLREAYVELNVPIGTGLDIKAGELISLLNWESGDGGAANPNFSQGLQWWFTGDGPSAGVQATYNFTDKVNLTLRVDNGLFQGPVDVNSGKALSGSLNFKPTKDLWINLIGWYEDASGGNDSRISGVSTIGGYQIIAPFGTGWEVDYFNISSPGTTTELWSVGGWFWYDLTPKVDLALRADYVDDRDGLLGPAVRPGAGLPFSSDSDGYLGSVTLTLNLKPAPNIKIQPEVRYDYTSYSGGLQSDGKKDRIIVGCGVTYLF